MGTSDTRVRPDRSAGFGEITATASPAVPLSQGGVEAVAAAFRFLVEVADAARGAGHGALPDAGEAFAVAISPALSAGANVDVDVAATGFFCRDAELFGQEAMAARLALDLYTEGLRRIFIPADAPPDELEALGRLLVVDWASRSAFEEDLEAAAWRVGLQFVSLEILDVIERELSPDGEEDPVSATLTALDQGRLDDSFGRTAEAARELRDGLRKVEYRRRKEGSKVEAGFLPGEEPPWLSGLLDELALVTAAQDVPIDRLATLVFEVLRQEPDKDGAVTLARAASAHIRQLLLWGRPDEASAILRGLMALLDRGLFPDWPWRDELNAELLSLVGGRAQEALIGAAGRDANPDRWRAFLFNLASALPEDGYRALCELGAGLGPPALRAAIADGLGLRLEGNAAAAKQLVEQSEGAALGVALMAAGRSGHALLEVPLLARVGHGLPAVREAALVALRGMRSPRIYQVMGAALRDPVAGVRLEALRYLVVHRPPESGTWVLERLGAVSLAQCEASELRGLAIAGARLAPGQAVPVLERLLGAPGAEGPALEAIGRGLLAAGQPGRLVLARAAERRPEIAAFIQAEG